MLTGLASAQVEDNYQEKIKVYEHLTDIVVKDSNGKFVKGLDRSGFTVFLNGKRFW